MLCVLAAQRRRCVGSDTAAVGEATPPNPVCPALQEEFLENLHKAAEALQRTVPRVVEFIAGKRLSQL